MTLIVGINTGTRLQLMSDTRISHPDVTQIEEIPGRLKLILLGPMVCVGYAGPADWAIDVIRGLPTGNDVAMEPVLASLLGANVESGGNLDFIVGCTYPVPHLYVISAGRTENVSGEGCIGDAEAVQEFGLRRLSARIPGTSSPDSEKILPSLSVFHDMIVRRVVPTVGGIQIRASSTPGGFCYLDESMAYYPPQTIPAGGPTRLRFGSAAEGAFAYSLMVPRETGQSIVAVYFLQGRLGSVYAPLLHDKPLQVPETSQDGLRSFVLQHYDVEIDGLAFS